MDRRIGTASAVVLLLVTGAVWGATRAETAPAGSPEIVTIGEGAVAVTVGGIGHVTTLSDAARLAANPAADTASASIATSGAVFATVTGHVTELLVAVGDKVRPGQPIARLADDGTVASTLIQAESDLANAQLELAQKRVQDPARGLPPTRAELELARSSIAAAQNNLSRVTGDPLPADLAAAHQELARATADLKAEQANVSSRPEAMEAAELAVEAASKRLALVTGAPDPVEVATAELELARAQLEQEALLTQVAPPSAAEVAAADAAIVAAQEKLTAAQAGGVTADIAAAQAELARATADRAVLTRATPAATAVARRAAQLAVDTAQRKLDQLLKPTPSVVAAAQAELARVKSDLSALRAADGDTQLAAARSSVATAESRLDLLVNPPPEVVSTLRVEVARATAELAVLRQRGAPASEADLEIAELKVKVAEQQVLLAHQLIERLEVRAPAAGTVTSVLTSGGAAVDGATPLVRIQDLANLVVSVNLTEFDVSRTRIGAAARIRADALGGRPYTGEVLDVALTGSDTGGVVTFPVIASIADATDLRPGMSVSLRVVVAAVEDAVRLPLDAIEDREGKVATIRVRTKTGELREREVKLGLVGAAYAEVKSGLRPGDKVAIPVEDEEA
jgi:RND family efflux transporter MFP subunit